MKLAFFGAQFRAVKIRLAPHRLGASTNCPNNIVVARTATEVALKPVTNFHFTGIRIIRNQIQRTHDYAWRAKATLQTMVGFERLLHWMKSTVFRKTLNSTNISTLNLNCQ